MKKVFTIFIVLLPILSIYKSPVPSLDLATFLAIPIAFLVVIVNLKNDKVYFCDKKLIILLLYIFLSTFLCLCFNIYNVNLSLILVRLLRYIFMLTFILILGHSECFDIQLAIKYIRIVALVSVAFIILQFLSYNLMGKIIYGVYYPLRVTSDYNLSNITSREILFYRPSSFFLEPSHFTQYIIVYLTYCLFSEKISKMTIFEAIMITIGILISTSGIGYVICLGLWILFFMNRLFKSNISPIKIILVFIGIIIFLFLIMCALRLEFVQTALDRVFTNDISGGNAIDPRISGYSYFLELPFINKIFGVGFGNVALGVYMNSVAYFLYCTGVVGSLILFSIFVTGFTRTKGFYKVLCLAVFAISFVGDCLGAILFCYYFSFIYSGYNNNLQQKNINRIKSKYIK